MCNELTEKQNSRRLAKSIISGGHYCRNLSHPCQNSESREPVIKLMPAADGGALIETHDTKYDLWTYLDDEMLDLDFGHRSKM